MFVSFINALTRFHQVNNQGPAWLDNKAVNLKLKLDYVNFSNKIQISEEVYYKKTFCHFPNVRIRTNAFNERQVQTTKCKNTKENCRSTGGVSSHTWPLAGVKTMLCIPCKQCCRTGALVLGILPGAGAQIKNQEPEPELSLKLRAGTGDMAIWEVAPAPGPFQDTNGFAKLSEN